MPQNLNTKNQPAASERGGRWVFERGERSGGIGLGEQLPIAFILRSNSRRAPFAQRTLISGPNWQIHLKQGENLAAIPTVKPGPVDQAADDVDRNTIRPGDSLQVFLGTAARVEHVFDSENYLAFCDPEALNFHHACAVGFVFFGEATLAAWLVVMELAEAERHGAGQSDRSLCGTDDSLDPASE